MQTQTRFKPVAFTSEGATLRGRLYMPADGGSAQHPLVIMTPGFSVTVSMMTDRYAEVFAAHSLAVLLYDPRNIGASDGEPRREVNAWVQARGYRDAVDFARTLPEIDAGRIALWGISNSGMIALVLAAVLGDRIAAATTLVPSCGAEPPPADPDGRLYRLLCETLDHGDVAGTPETTIGPLPVVSAAPLHQPAHLHPPSFYRWFMEHGGQFGSGWVNDATRVNPATPAPFSPGIAAPHIRVPVQVIYAPDDEIERANPVVTRQVCASLGGPNEIVELDPGCGHTGALWYPSTWFDRVTTLQSSFLNRQLTGADRQAVRSHST